MCDDVKFSVLSSLFDWISKSKSSSLKRSKFRKFLDHFCSPGDYFGAIRLILPSLDRERGSYGLKESTLAVCIIDALGMSRESEDAVRLINWRKGGAKTGYNAGNFALVAAEVLQRRQGTVSGGLTIRELNDLLDRLASSESRTEKMSVLADLIRKTNAQEMKWIVMIILKDLKLGISEKSIFHEFHPDAEDMFNVTCDLKLVCEKLKDRSQRHKRQDIEVGKAIRPQLAMRVSNAAAAWKKLHGKEVVVECKFDGDRIQIHKNGADIHFFSRNFLDHPEYGHAMSNIVMENILEDRCILDGEMLVWDTLANRFAEFGSNQEIAKAAREGLDSDRQLCYVAFDILYAGDTSVIHQSLKERQELLKKVFKPLKGRFEILVPNGGLNRHRSSGEPCWSLIAQTVDDVEGFFKDTIENRDEGIVVKDLGSKWEPGDRSGKWMKLKPEYICAGSDLDVLIIGGYYGSGRHGGEVAQFLLGLAERSTPNSYPRRFISFCRVGTGLSDEECDELVTKLKPFFRKAEPKKGVPSFLQVTNNSKERPDVWIESPEKSVILSITSDIRTIRSEVFAAPYSLRFPRIDRVRYDKPWHECLDVQTFIELVHSSNGTTQRRAEDDMMPEDKPKQVKSVKREVKKKQPLVPSHFVLTDVSTVKGESLIFSDLVFYFVNVPPGYSLDMLHKMVTENGGTFSMNLNDKVTHCIAAESKGIKFEAAKLHRDVIHHSWVLDCCSEKKLLPLQPKFFLFLSASFRMKLQDEIDEFSDFYYSDINVGDLKQILSNATRSEDKRAVEHYKRKYCPNRKWCLFSGCRIYFHFLPQLRSPDWEILLKLASRRMGVELSVGGGKVCSDLSEATHMAVVSVPGFAIDSKALLESFPREAKHVLCKKRLHIVHCQWLEDCMAKGEKLSETAYSLKPSDLEETISDEECKVDDQGLSASPKHEAKSHPVSPAKGQKRVSVSREQRIKRARPTETSGRKRKTTIRQPRRTRARLASKPAKLHEDGSDEAEPVDQGDLHEDEEAEAHHSETSGQKRKTTVRQPRRTRARLASKPTKLKEDGSDEAEPVDQAGPLEDEEVQAHQSDRTSEGKSPEVLSLGTNVQSQPEPSIFTGEETKYEPLDDTFCNEPDYSRETRPSDKLEVVVDPVHAMLLDMIPSLGLKKVESSSPVKMSQGSTSDVPKAEPSREEVGEPAKKKKVSYKDMANQLLKDW